MLISCPFCGSRDDAEFRYRGDASVTRPAADAVPDAFAAYVYERENPRGWQLEWWQHMHGCRGVVKVLRHTLSHDIAWVGRPGDAAPTPPQGDAA